MLRVKKSNGMMTLNDAEMANELNKAFQSVFVNESDLDLPTFGGQGITLRPCLVRAHI